MTQLTQVTLSIESEFLIDAVPVDDPPGVMWVHILEDYNGFRLYKTEGAALDVVYMLPDGIHPNPGGGIGYYKGIGYRADSLGTAVGPVVEITFDIITTLRDETVAKAITHIVV